MTLDLVESRTQAAMIAVVTAKAMGGEETKNVPIPDPVQARQEFYEALSTPPKFIDADSDTAILLRAMFPKKG